MVLLKARNTLSRNYYDKDSVLRSVRDVIKSDVLRFIEYRLEKRLESEISDT